MKNRNIRYSHKQIFHFSDFQQYEEYEFMNDMRDDNTTYGFGIESTDKNSNFIDNSKNLSILQYIRIYEQETLLSGEKNTIIT